MHPAEIARAVFEEIWNRQDFTNVSRFLAEEFALHVGAHSRITNAAELEEIVGRWHTAFPDFRFDIHSITSDDHIAAVHATLRGTHRGPWGALEPTGKRIEVEHAFFLRIEGAVIVEVWEILDQLDFKEQLTGKLAT